MDGPGEVIHNPNKSEHRENRRRDAYTPRLHFRLQEAGMPAGSALTMFDFIDLDEGRPPRFRE